VHRVATIAAAFVLSATAVAAQPSSPSSATKAAAGTSTSIQPGTYDLELAFGGGVMPGTLVITAVGDSIAAKVNVGDHAPPPVRRITRTGTHLTIDLGDAGVSVVYDLDFNGDAVAGKFTFNGDPGLVSGKRRK
jgi:hypothetical protein